MKRLLCALGLAAALAGCATRPPHPDAFTFGVLGDAPYSDAEAVAFGAMLAATKGERLAFLVHIGDVKAGGNSPCTDARYAEMKARLDASPHPLVLTPGDNDWTDCRRESNGRMDPLERLAALRRVFFADAYSLGRVRLPLAVQDGCAERSAAACRCPGLPENRLWSKNGVVFVTVHVVGSNDNRGFDAASDAEQSCRAAANRAWLHRAFLMASGQGLRGLAIFAQADPWVESRGRVYDDFVAQIAAGAKRLGKPVLFAHGDTHVYTVDRPFRDERGDTVANAVRLETYGSPNVGWVRVTVDPGDPDLFAFDPVLPSPSGG